MSDTYNVIKDTKNNTTYLIIRDTKFEKINDNEKEGIGNLTIVFNFDDLSKQLSPSYASKILKDFKSKSLKIENCLV